MVNTLTTLGSKLQNLQHQYNVSKNVVRFQTLNKNSPSVSVT